MNGSDAMKGYTDEEGAVLFEFESLSNFSAEMFQIRMSVHYRPIVVEPDEECTSVSSGLLALPSGINTSTFSPWLNTAMFYFR